MSERYSGIEPNGAVHTAICSVCGVRYPLFAAHACKTTALPTPDSQLSSLQRLLADKTADHAQIVAAKDEEIRRLRDALTLAEHKIDQYLQGQYPDGVSLGNILATLRAALNPPQQKEGQ